MHVCVWVLTLIKQAPGYIHVATSIVLWLYTNAHVQRADSTHSVTDVHLVLSLKIQFLFPAQSDV